MEFGKRHDTTDTTDFCPRQLVTDLPYGETGVMDFGLYAPPEVGRMNSAVRTWPILLSQRWPGRRIHWLLDG